MSEAARIKRALDILESINGGAKLAAEVLDQLAHASDSAASMREAFLRRKVDHRARTVKAPDPTGPLWELGELTEVGYVAKKGGDRSEYEYVHRFEAPTPRLCANHAGKLVIVGGGYVITPAGIVR